MSMKRIVLLITTIAPPIVLVLLLSACSPKKPELPKTELPQTPQSAELPCERLSDEEIIECIKDPASRDICRKLEVNCVRYDDLKDFVKRTWSARDKK